MSNGLFLVSAWFAWRRAEKAVALSPGVWLLLSLAAAIGIGSALLHTFE